MNNVGIALAVLIVVVVVGGAITAGVCFGTCMCGLCPSGCRDCEYTLEHFEIISTEPGYAYVAHKEHCGDKLYLDPGLDHFKISTKPISGSKERPTNPNPAIVSYHKSSTEIFNLYWKMERTSRNNETLTLVFEDDGTEYMGLGGFKDSILRPKGVAETYTLWSTEKDPYYFPFYLTRNSHGAICMCADAGGAPLEVTVSSSATSWTVYSLKVDFYFFAGDTAMEALNGCLEKWAELYTFTNTAWSDKVIFGSTNTGDIATARSTADILATQYLLSVDNIEVNGDVISVKDPLADMSDVYITWGSRVEINKEKVDSLNSSGIFAAGDGTYYLDYSKADIATWLSTMLATTSTSVAGFILTEGHLPGQIQSRAGEEEGSLCNYLYCSTLDYNEDSTPCSATPFGEQSVLFNAHNTYDRVRADFLKTAAPDSLVMYSTASPGLTNYYKENVAASWEGLQECMNELVNMQLVGVYGYTCNMCGGVGSTTDTLCDRWSQLSILMPLIVMSNEETFPFIVDKEEPGRYIRNNLNVRSMLRYYLEDQFNKAVEAKKAFIYPVTLTMSDDEEYGVQTNVMIGDSLFFAPVLDTAISNIEITLPPGSEWIQFQSGIKYAAGEVRTITSTTAMSDLLYFKIGSGTAFITADMDKSGYTQLHLCPAPDEYSISTTYTLHENTDTQTLTISIPPTNEKILVTHESGTDLGLKVSKIFVYYWYEQKAGLPAWITYIPLLDSKYNIEYDFVAGGMEDVMLSNLDLSFSSPS